MSKDLSTGSVGPTTSISEDSSLSRSVSPSVNEEVRWIGTHTTIKRYCHGTDLVLSLGVKGRADGQQSIEGCFDECDPVGRIRLVVCSACVKNLDQRDLAKESYDSQVFRYWEWHS